jgi:hypothetical protein
MFNARCETVASKGIFSRLLKDPSHRCIVCVEGFYEWKEEHKVKQPYYIHRQDRPLLFAGLHDNWKDGEEPGVDMSTVTILTTNSSARLKWLHERMPVILRDADACSQWLSAPLGELSSVLKPYNDDDLAWYAVTRAVNRMDYKGKDCAKPLKVAKVSSFFRPNPAEECKNDDLEKKVKGYASVALEGPLKQEVASTVTLNDSWTLEMNKALERRSQVDGAGNDGCSDCGVQSGATEKDSTLAEHPVGSTPKKHTSGRAAREGNKRQKVAEVSGSKSLLSFYSKAPCNEEKRKG